VKRPLKAKIRTQQQPDSTWKAWTVGGRLEVHAETEAKAIDIVKLFFGDDEQDQIKDIDDLPPVE